METGIVLAIVAVLKGVLLLLIAGLRTQLKQMASRILHLEDEIEKCHESRIQEQRQIGSLEAQIAGLRNAVNHRAV